MTDDNVERIPTEIPHSLGSCNFCRTAIEILSGQVADKQWLLNYAQHLEEFHFIALKHSNITEWLKEIFGR